MKKQPRIVARRRQSAFPAPLHLPLVDILIDTQAELQELVVASGLKVLEAMLEEDRAAVCGPQYAHQAARQAYRAGHAPSQVVLGGRKVAIQRPRARRDGTEVPLPTARAFADADPLNRRVVDQMLIGVATRQYARSLDPLGAEIPTRGTSKSAVSRRFVAHTQAQLDAWRATPLDDLDLAVLLIDGAKALDTAVTQTFGRAAVMQRCQVHKRRNILEHLPETQRPWVKAILTRAYTHTNVKTATRLLQDLARRLDTDYPSAAASVREGLDDTLTVLGLGLSERLQRSLATTNAIESLLSRTRHVQRNVKRWRGGDDGAALGGRQRARSREGVPSGERMQRYAGPRRCPPGTRRAVRTRGVVNDGRVVLNRTAAEFQQRTGHPLEATATQQLPDWVGAHTRLVEFFGGATALWVPDQLKSAITRPCRYEPRRQSHLRGSSLRTMARSWSRRAPRSPGTRQRSRRAYWWHNGGSSPGCGTRPSSVSRR